MKKNISIVTLLILIFAGALLSGCAPDYSSLSLSLNTQTIELSESDEKVDYHITINNYFEFNPQFSFDFASNIAKVVENSIIDRGNGDFVFSIAPITSGRTTLTITLKGLNKPLVVPVVVRKDLESITASTNQFVKKGTSLKIDSSMFTFTPADTTETGLNFALANTEEINYSDNGVTFDENTNLLSVDSNCSLDSIVLTATSTFDANIQTNIAIKVVKEIDLNSLKLQIASQDNENIGEFGEFTDLNFDTQIELVISEQFEYQKKINVLCDKFDQGYAVEIDTKAPIYFGNENITHITKTQNSDFTISASDVGTSTIKFKVYQMDVPGNYKDVVINVRVLCKPKSITVNNQTSIDVIELYTNSSEVKEYKFGIAPAKANKDDYNYAISYYSVKSTEEVLSNANQLASLSEFIDLTYGGTLVGSSLGKLESSLKMQALKSTGDNYLVIKIDCIDGELEGEHKIICSLNMYIKVYIGTTEFKIDDIYENGTIYLSIEDGVQTFYGLKCSKGSTPGRLTIRSVLPDDAICSIVQEETSNANLTITPNKVGTQEFVITTANNLSVILKVVVFRQIAESDFVVQIADISNDNISSFTLNANQSLASLVVKGLNSNVNLIGSTTTIYTDYNDNSFVYAMSLTDEGQKYFSILNNKTIKSLKFTKEYDSNTNNFREFIVPLTVKLTMNIVEKINDESTFILKQEENLLEVNLKCVNYIKELSLYASNDQDGSVKAKTASIYNKGDLSYINQNLANAYLFMDLVQSAQEEFTGLSINNFTFKSGAEEFKTEVISDTLVKVGEIGYFYPNFEASTNGYVGCFTYDYNNLRTLDSITIILSLTDENTKNNFSSEVTLSIEKYIDVESIWLSSPTDVVYLDNTNTYAQKTISVQILPANAMCKDLEVKIETNQINCIGVDIKDNVITFSYQSAGSGKILIFPVSKMKTNSFTDEFGEYYYHLELDFKCADGSTEETALKISTLKDIKAISPNLHYFVDSTINCQGETLDIIGLTTGSIRGTFLAESEDGFKASQQIGSIINYKVAPNGTNTIGIFRKLEAGAKIYNISFSGYFEEKMDLQTHANIGLLCGINYGTIKNVNVNLYKQNSVVIKNVSEAEIKINFGFVAGENAKKEDVQGKIETNTDCKDYTLMANNDAKSKLIVNFVEPTATAKITSNIGGVVGVNNGIIQQTLEDSFITIGLYGISANIFITSNATYLAGVCGENSGTVTGLKVAGEVVGLVKEDGQEVKKAKNVAGFIAKIYQSTIENNISRVFVRGGNNIAGFACEISSSTLANNKLQAVDDGTRAGIDASFVVGYGDDSNVKAISFSTTAEVQVKAETYFDRNLPSSLIALLTQYGISYNANGMTLDFVQLKVEHDEGFSYQLTDSLSKDYYYGEVVKLANSNIDFVYIDYKTAFARGEEDSFVTENFVSNFVLSAYMQAQDANNQIYISNSIDTTSILKFANVIREGVLVKDFNIEILNPLTARLENFGKKIKILNIGALNIRISSSLNYKNSANLNLQITNYYDDIKLYTSKDKTEELALVQLVNKQTTTAYLSLYSYSYNYKNTPISLIANNEVTFDVGTITYSQLSVRVQGQIAYFEVTGDTLSDLQTDVSFISKFVYNDKTYYKITNKFINGINEEKFYAFVSQDDLAKCGATDASREIKTIRANLTTGIEDIKLSKSIVQAEPSDSISVELSYITYNASDKIVPVLRVYESDISNNYFEYQLNDGAFLNGENKILFKLSLEELPKFNNRLRQQYVLKMPIESDFDLDVYNYLLNKKVELIFRSSVAYSQSASLIVQYIPESISSVLINNYSKNFNSGLFETENGVTKINVENMLYSGNQCSTGELNVLQAYIYTKLSEFEYVDVSMNISTEGGYLGYVEYSEVDGKIVGKLSNKSVYTSITTGATIRIYKNEIKEDFLNNTLLLVGIMYKIPKTVADGTIVPITFTFYSKNSSEPYVQTINLLSKIANQVSFEIYNKQAIEEYDDTKTYNVARGIKYALDTTIVGYSIDEAVFESSNPNIANVTREGNAFYLTISDASIFYGESQYFEAIIYSYGVKDGGSSADCTIKTTKLHIYEFMVDENNLFGDNTTISLRMLDNVNIKNIIVGKINFEYSRITANVLGQFKQSYLDNAKYYLVENGNELELKEGVYKETSDYKLVCLQENGKLAIKFTPLKIGEPCNYKFMVRHLISYNKGIPSAIGFDDTNLNIVEQVFDVDCFIASTGKNPIPIYTYKDLQNVKDGEYYRQVADISVSASELKMILASPKLFDGNGYKITITSGVVNFDLDSSSDFALFKTVLEGCMLQNVVVVIEGNLNLTLNNNLSTNGANIALLVAENNGIITNCSVSSTGVVNVDILSTLSVMEKSLFAGLCAINSGYITNSRVECNLTASGASLAGLVADNAGNISSCYIKNSRIYNTTSTTSESINTSGFVCNNTGTIKMCYVEGTTSSSNRIYCDYSTGDYSLTSKIIYTSTKVAGFVFANSGEISDCYSNIPIVSTNESSGFVAKAIGGTITRVFSLCKLKQEDTLNYGFVSSYNKDDALFEDCFFVIHDGIINYNTSETNYTKAESGNYTFKIKGVMPLNIEDFNVLDSNGNLKKDNKFASFITDKNPLNGIWFYAYNGNQEKSTPFEINTYSCVVDGFEEKGQSKSFVARRLQLVSPNLISLSKYDIALAQNGSVENGEYAYYGSSEADSLGTKTNPYLISSAKEFEEYCKLSSMDFGYFRLVCDIDYQKEEIYSSTLFNKILTGYFEGNGFTISNYAVNSITSNLSAGLFAEIGKSISETSSFKNTKFIPSYINLPNSVYVGGIAGSVTNANIYNVQIEEKDVVIVGSNIVGGMFGRTYGEVNINNVYSNITAKASTYNSIALKVNTDVKTLVGTISYNENNTNNKNKVAYAGAIIGYVGGITKVTKANIGIEARALAMIAGLMYGGVGASSVITDFNLDLNSFNNQVVAYAFGGYVAGELNGEVSNFTINSDIINTELFSCHPVAPVALGGVAGYSANNAKVLNFTSTNGYAVIGARIIGKDENEFLKVHNPYIAKYVGGIVGYSGALQLDNIDIAYNNLEENLGNVGIALLGGHYVAGAIGYAEKATSNSKFVINKTNIALIGSKTYLNADEQEVTDNLYVSYVSEAVGEAIEYSRDERLYFGYMYNENYGENNVTATDSDVKVTEGLKVNNETYGLIIFYAKYNMNLSTLNHTKMAYPSLNDNCLTQENTDITGIRFINLTDAQENILTVSEFLT